MHEPTDNKNEVRLMLILFIVISFLILHCDRGNAQSGFITINQYDTSFNEKPITIRAINIDETSIAFDDIIVQVLKYKIFSVKGLTEITYTLKLYTPFGVISLYYFDYKDGLVLLTIPYYNINLLLIHEYGELLL